MTIDPAEIREAIWQADDDQHRVKVWMLVDGGPVDPMAYIGWTVPVEMRVFLPEETCRLTREVLAETAYPINILVNSPGTMWRRASSRWEYKD